MMADGRIQDAPEGGDRGGSGTTVGPWLPGLELWCTVLLPCVLTTIGSLAGIRVCLSQKPQLNCPCELEPQCVVNLLNERSVE